MKMKFPELLACHNSSYERVLKAEISRMHRLASQSYCNSLYAGEMYHELKRELRRVKEAKNEHPSEG